MSYFFDAVSDLVLQLARDMTDFTVDDVASKIGLSHAVAARHLDVLKERDLIVESGKYRSMTIVFRLKEATVSRIDEGS